MWFLFLYPDICIPSRPSDLGCSCMQTKIEHRAQNHIDLIMREMALGLNRNYYIKKRKYSERQVLAIIIFYFKKSDIDDCFVFL